MAVSVHLAGDGLTAVRSRYYDWSMSERAKQICTFRLDREHRETLDAWAETRGITRSQALREILEAVRSDPVNLPSVWGSRDSDPPAVTITTSGTGREHWHGSGSNDRITLGEGGLQGGEGNPYVSTMQVFLP